MGAVYFTADAAGSPGNAHNAAVTATFDNLIGVVAIEMSRTSVFTRHFRTQFLRPVRILNPSSASNQIFLLRCSVLSRH
jgi:hypothetical protein